MITIEGTVTDILGYPTLFFSRDARRPAVSAPINAAAAGGIFARSTSSSLRVLATAPIPAAATARPVSYTHLFRFMTCKCNDGSMLSSCCIEGIYRVT